MILTCDITKKPSVKYHRYDNGKHLYAVTQYLNWSLIVIFMLIHCSVHVDGMKSFCMSPTTELGKEAIISCHFGDDISKTQQDAVVYIYKDTGKKPVVQYAWFNGKHTILQENGYECDETISDYLVVRIPHTTREHAAQYSCIVAPSEKEEVTPCTLKLLTDGSTTTQAEHVGSVHKSDTSAKIQCTSRTVQMGESATLTCTFGNETSQLQRNIYVDHQQTSSVEDHELVVACHWYSGRIDCRSIAGFEVVGDVTNQLTFRINEVLQWHSGKYTCDVLGSSSEKNSCVLTVTRTTNTSPTDKEENGCEGNHTCLEKKVIIGLAVAVVCLVIILMAFIILLRRNTQSTEDFKNQKSTPIYKKILKSLQTGEKDTRTLKQLQAV